MSGLCPSTPPPEIWKTCRKRANTCANGKNNKRRESSPAAISGIQRCEFTASSVKLPCVSTVPLGRPVVPDVYTIVAIESVVSCAMRPVSTVRRT